MNFLGQGKYVYAWDVMSGGLYTIDRLDVIDPDDFIQHAQIKLKE